MAKEKNYYTKPIFQDSCYTQCLWDLAGGEIKIYDIPFEYRPGLAYILAKKQYVMKCLERIYKKKKNCL